MVVEKSFPDNSVIIIDEADDEEKICRIFDILIGYGAINKEASGTKIIENGYYDGDLLAISFESEEWAKFVMKHLRLYCVHCWLPSKKEWL
jgi:hypothetical protein